MTSAAWVTCSDASAVRRLRAERGVRRVELLARRLL
jgi:hypothetical protein